MRNEDQFVNKWGLLRSWIGSKRGEETKSLNVRWVATVAGRDHEVTPWLGPSTSSRVCNEGVSNWCTNEWPWPGQPSSCSVLGWKNCCYRYVFLDTGVVGVRVFAIPLPPSCLWLGFLRPRLFGRYSHRIWNSDTSIFPPEQAFSKVAVLPVYAPE